MSFDPQPVRGARGAAAGTRHGLHELDFPLRSTAVFRLGHRLQPGHLAQTAAFNAAPNSGGCGPAIWMAGGGPAADARGERLPAHRERRLRDDAGQPAASRTGRTSAIASCGSPAARYGVSDYFSMSNAVAESGADQDLGSGGILLLPDLHRCRQRHAVIWRWAPARTPTSTLLTATPWASSALAATHLAGIAGVLAAGIWSTPAYYNAARLLRYRSAARSGVHHSAAKLAASICSSATFNYPGTSPTVSANGSREWHRLGARELRSGRAARLRCQRLESRALQQLPGRRRA